MAPEELLCSANNVSDYDRGAQREDEVLIVRMQNESLVHLACRERVSEIPTRKSRPSRTYP